MTSLEFEMARSNQESAHTMDFAAGVFVLCILVSVAAVVGAWMLFA